MGCGRVFSARAAKRLTATAIFLCAATRAHADEVRPPLATAAEARATLDHLISEREATRDESCVLREKTRSTALALEAFARASEDDPARLALLEQAALGCFAAAVPSDRDRDDDPLRLTPGAAWKDYERLAWEIVAARGGVDRLDAARILFPAIALKSEVHRIGPVYGSEFRRPAVELFEKSHNDAVRVCAGAYAAQLSLFGDWASACALANETAAIEAQANLENEPEIHAVWLAVDDLARAFEEHLGQTESDLRRALDLYAGDRKSYPPARALADAGHLWSTLSEYLPDAVRSGVWSRRRPEWMDLDSNRLLTIPGLRLCGVSQIVTPDGGSRPVLLTAIRLWDGWTRADSLPPWTRRRDQRLAALEAQPPR